MERLFLTGPRRAGKSTLWRQAFALAGVRPAGFVVERVLRGGELDGHDLCDLTTGERAAIVRKTDAGWTTVPEGFDGLGRKVLLEACAGRRVILMDELGNREEASAGFREAVWRCLDGEAPVCGVIKQADSPFLNRVRARDDVRLLVVSPDNRDLLLPGLVAWLKTAAALE